MNHVNTTAKDYVEKVIKAIFYNGKVYIAAIATRRVQYIQC